MAADSYTRPGDRPGGGPSKSLSTTVVHKSPGLRKQTQEVQAGTEAGSWSSTLHGVTSGERAGGSTGASQGCSGP